jgi:hypothetical protein
VNLSSNLISAEPGDPRRYIYALDRTLHTVAILYTPIKELLLYWSTVVCQELLSFIAFKIYARKRVHRILCGELPEGSWLMCDAVGATEYNDSWALIKLYGGPRWKGHVNTKWLKKIKLPCIWSIVSQQRNNCIVHNCNQSCLCPINVFTFLSLLDSRFTQLLLWIFVLSWGG